MGKVLFGWMTSQWKAATSRQPKKRTMPQLRAPLVLAVWLTLSAGGILLAESIDFETDAGGFAGGMVRDETQAHGGKASGRINADLSAVTKQAWVTAKKPLDITNEIKHVTFWIKSSDARQITVRLVDATGQTHQVRPVVDPTGAWREVTIGSFAAGPGQQSYGGANDKIIHWPAKELAFIVEKTALKDGKGIVWLDDIRLDLSAERAVSPIKMAEGQRVFLTSESVRLPVDTQGNEVAWSITDFCNQPQGQGVAPATDSRAVIEPGIKEPGYYEVQIKAMKDGSELAGGQTSFVVLAPFDLAAVADSPFGVMTHFAQKWPVDVLPLIARAGIKNIRDELYWAHVEKTKASFAFPELFDKYMAAARAEHVEPLICLDFGNPNYDHTADAPGYGNAPYTDEGRAAYARYGVEVLQHYGPQIKAVEIWNEYNGTFGKGPAAKDKPGNYFEMLRVAHTAIKKARPDVTVVGVSAVATPMPYFEDLFQRGALRYMDALSLHPYRTQGTPEGLDKQMTKLQELIKKYNDGKPLPLWITELGWYVKGRDARSDVIVTEADQARYLVRALALSLGAGVEKFYWYHGRDDAPFPFSGLLRSPEDPKGRYAPKPSYAAYATLTRQLTGATFERREMTKSDDVYSLLFRRGAEEIRVMWALEPVTFAVQAAAPLTLVDLVGGTQTIPFAAGESKLELTDTPAYVRGKITGLPPMDPSVGELVADAEEEFSSRQGDDGWSYGSFLAAAPGGPYDPAAWTPLPEYRTTIWGYEWIGGPKHLLLAPSGAHPATDQGKPVWTVRRWTSDVTGEARLTGRFGRPEKGDGTTARIFVDGREVWKQQIGGGQPASAKYDVTVPVHPGSLVDYAVDPGPGTDTSFDATSMSATITLLTPKTP